MAGSNLAGARKHSVVLHKPLEPLINELVDEDGVDAFGGELKMSKSEAMFPAPMMLCIHTEGIAVGEQASFFRGAQSMLIDTSFRGADGTIRSKLQKAGGYRCSLVQWQLQRVGRQ